MKAYADFVGGSIQGPVVPAAQSQSQSQTRNSTTKSPARLSRNSTSTTIIFKDRGKGKEKEKERDTEGEDAGETANAVLATATGTSTTAAANNGTGTTNGANGSADVTRHTASTPAHTPGANSAIDPLSQQIFMRKNTEPSIPQRLTQMAEGLTRASTELSRSNATPASGDVGKDKGNKKGGSFLSRLRGSRKKDLAGVDFDSDSEMGSEARTDGTNARIFSQTVGSPFIGAGYVPHHKEPPRYIRTRSSNKRTREFNRMFLAQELVGTRPPENEGDGSAAVGTDKAPVVSVSVAGASDRKATRTGGAIWATEFSKDGRYLATGGRDHVVRVWGVLATPEDRNADERDDGDDGEGDHNGSGGSGERLSAPVFKDQPVMEFRGHTGEVLDLSWSKNNFLLSSSMDKTVRLWHMSRNEALCTFKHKDFVTRLAFHPRDDRFFLAGSLDTMLRLWSIPDSAVAFSAQLPDLVTAVAFSPDGNVAIAGLLNGMCMFYETEGLKLSSQIHVRSSRGKNAKGSKITGIQTMAVPPPNPLEGLGAQAPGSAAASVASTAEIAASAKEVRVLITSNDSRIRIYSLRDKTLGLKLKGHENACSQIAATFSDDGKHVICGSEDRKTFIWSLAGNAALVQDKDKFPCEHFEAHGDIVTTAVFAPTKTRMLLGQGGDPIYDLCNPPPVVLQSLEEAASAAASQVALTNDSHQPSHADTAPTASSALMSPPPTTKKPEPSAGYIARSTHYDGNVIVTTGDTGIIKVFRQDCAFPRRRYDSWETGSTLSRKLAAAAVAAGSSGGGGYVVTAGGLRRSGSVVTRTSASSTTAPHSRRGSLSQPFPPGSGVQGSPHHSVAVGAHPDRILSWRQGIEHGGSAGGGVGSEGRAGDRRSALLASGTRTPTRSERSLSPTKASRTSLNSAYNNFASEARRQPYAGASPSATGHSVGLGIGPGAGTAAAARARAGGSLASPLASPTTSVFSSPPASLRESQRDRIPGRLVKDKESRAGSLLNIGRRRSSVKKEDVPQVPQPVQERQSEQKQRQVSSPPTPGFTFKSADTSEGGDDGVAHDAADLDVRATQGPSDHPVHTTEPAPSADPLSSSSLAPSPMDQPTSTSPSTSFWNLNRWRGITSFKSSSGDKSPSAAAPTAQADHDQNEDQPQRPPGPGHGHGKRQKSTSGFSTRTITAATIGAGRPSLGRSSLSRSRSKSKSRSKVPTAAQLGGEACRDDGDEEKDGEAAGRGDDPVGLPEADRGEGPGAGDAVVFEGHAHASRLGAV
ncbi:hypothetical protein B0J18DRAFT_80649 [Chaetomium sp. MPI-SDFR-AT-0129]|nr:hypothetical protein B0J18DRAFT_80649 [Chaetomium sp. MPI-SDFR-AT-0129]